MAVEEKGDVAIEEEGDVADKKVPDVASEEVPDVATNEVPDNLHNVRVEAKEHNNLVDSDYEQSEDDCYVVNKGKQPAATATGSSEDPNRPVGFDSEFEVSADELDSCAESDIEVGENRQQKRKKFTEFNPQTDFADPHFRLGIEFPNIEAFRKAIREYAIKQHRAVRFVMNEKFRCRVKCKDPCPWMIFASNIQNSELCSD